ncbi:MAG: type II toxin-antitoxin system VapC family toxin [Candidatus Dormibacteria bacterium]
MGGIRLSGLLLDTHIWWWYLTGSDRLPLRLRCVIDEAPADRWLSPVSIWETGKLVSRGRLSIPTDFRSWVVTAMGRFPVNDAPFNQEVALVSDGLKLPHRDPADHFIAATAIVYELVLLTVDQRLTKTRAISTRSK